MSETQFYIKKNSRGGINEGKQSSFTSFKKKKTFLVYNLNIRILLEWYLLET